MNFDKQLPGGKNGKPDKDEMDMMNDIMGGDSSMGDSDLDISGALKA